MSISLPNNLQYEYEEKREKKNRLFTAMWLPDTASTYDFNFLTSEGGGVGVEKVFNLG